MKTFQRGQEYIHTDWFTGGICNYKVKSRTDTAVVFIADREELDGHFVDTEEHKILLDADGNEYVLLFEYEGVKCVIQAK